MHYFKRNGGRSMGVRDGKLHFMLDQGIMQLYIARTSPLLETVKSLAESLE